VFGLVKLEDMASGQQGEGDGFFSESQAKAIKQLFSTSSSEEYAQDSVLAVIEYMPCH